MTLVHAIDRGGVTHTLPWEPEQSLMECLRDNDLPVLASCGGNAACSTCHVYLDPEVVASLGERGEDEADLLEETDYFQPDSSRLSCQIRWSERLDGITVTLAPED